MSSDIPFEDPSSCGHRYMCRDPKKIKFAPLNKTVENTAEELMTIYEVSSETPALVGVADQSPE